MSDEQDAVARATTEAGDASVVEGDVVEGVVEHDVVEGDGPTEAPEPTRLRMRRAPRYRAFGGTGVAIGVAVGVILALSFKADSNYSIQTITGYFAASFALFGGVLGLGLAVLLERRRS